MTSVPKRELINVLQECDGYKGFAAVCQKRVDLLEATQAHSEQIIREQEARVLAHGDEVESLKRQRNILTPIGAALLGIAVGVFYQSQQE